MSASRDRRCLLVIVLGSFMLLPVACSADSDTTETDAVSAPRADGSCEPSRAPVSPSGPATEARTLRTADDEGPGIDAAVYPRPDTKRELWSQWGQGLVLADGRFVSAIGDHEGADGNSYLFVYDPADRRLTRFADVLSQVEHEAGGWGYGKIHAQMVGGLCGEVYLATYWGTRDDIEYTPTYQGDLIFRLDPATLELQALGVPAPEHGIPTLAGAPSQTVLYGGAADPVYASDGNDQGEFFAFDVERGDVVFRADDERLIGFRTILVDARGTAFLAARDGRLLTYESGGEELHEHPERLPGGGWLRAAATPAPDGTVYGVTNEPYTFFALDPDGSIRDLGEARGYTTSLAVAPDGSRFYYVPDAHGHAQDLNTPLIEVDTETGEQTVLAELNELAEDELGLTLGGTYNVALDPDTQSLYIGFNAGTEHDEPWGEVVLVVVHL